MVFRLMQVGIMVLSKSSPGSDSSETSLPITRSSVFALVST